MHVINVFEEEEEEQEEQEEQEEVSLLFLIHSQVPGNAAYRIKFYR